MREGGERPMLCGSTSTPRRATAVAAMTAVSWKRSKLRNYFITEAVRHYDYLFQAHAVVATTAGVTDEASEVG